MPSLKDIRKRISSVKNTQKITRAMKLVSTAKLKRAQSAMSELRPYAAKYRELLGSLVAQVGEAAHPLMESRAKVRRVGVFALTSDRGMCGAFNAQIQKAVVRLAAERDAELVLYPLGRRVNKFARKSEFAVGEAFGEITPATSTESVRRISDALVGAFMAGEIDEAVVIFNEFQSAISQVPVVRQLLPVAAETADEGLDDLADLI